MQQYSVTWGSNKMKNIVIIVCLCVSSLITACGPIPRTAEKVDPCYADLPVGKKIVSLGFDSRKIGSGPWYSVRDMRPDESAERYELFVLDAAAGASRLNCDSLVFQERK